MLLNNTIKELYSSNSNLINNDNIINIVTNKESYKTENKYINISHNPSFIRKENDILWDLTLGIPFLDKSVNLIYCQEFFHTLNYDEQTYFLQEAFRTLKDNGVLKLSFRSVNFEAHNDLEFNKEINTIPERPFINSRDGLINRIEALGINKQCISINDYIEITKPSDLLIKDVPNIKSLVPEVFDIIEKPSISILYLSCNHAHSITESMEAILQQSYHDFEVIWDDDGSCDFTMLFMKKYQNKYPHIVKTPFYGVKSVGRVKSLQRTIKMANGEYLAICQDNDVWLDRTKLEKQWNFMLNHKLDCSSTSVIMKNDSLESALYSSDNKELLSYEDVLSLQYLYTLSSLMIKKNVFNNTPHGFWDLHINEYAIGLYVLLKNNLGLGFMDNCPTLCRKQRLQSSLTEFHGEFSHLFNMQNIHDYKNAVTKPIETDLIIFDEAYPTKTPFGWRGDEFEYYNNCNFHNVIMSMMTDKEEFDCNLKHYRKYSPNSNIIEYNPHRIINAKLAYVLFIANVYRVLPIIEQNKIPFVFTLYPGGSFSLIENNTYERLKTVLSSPFFKEVIVTEAVTKKYLLDNNLCEEDKIRYIFNGLSEERNFLVKNNMQVVKNRSQLNVCFCAFKYRPQGIDKGYDIFINVAKILSKTYQNIHFHVLGNFDENDIDCSGIHNIHFYGPLYGDNYLCKILEMDLILTLPRYGRLQKGAFNGFPLNADFARSGVPIFTTDELKCNTQHTDGKDIVILDFIPKNTASKVEYYYHHRDELSELARNCQKKIVDMLQAGSRIQLLNKYLQ